MNRKAFHKRSKKRILRSTIRRIEQAHGDAALFLQGKVTTKSGKVLSAEKTSRTLRYIKEPGRPQGYREPRRAPQGSPAWNEYIESRVRRGLTVTAMRQMDRVHAEQPTVTNSLAANILQADHYERLGQTGRAHSFYAAAQQDFLELEDLIDEDLSEEWLWYG